MNANGQLIWWLGVLLATIFAALSLLHIYWAAGGRLGSAAGIPTVDGQRAFNPTRGATLIVAGILLLKMLIVLGQLGLMRTMLPGWIFRAGIWGIVIVFGLRAIGEFRLVGFFKRVRNTTFARPHPRAKNETHVSSENLGNDKALKRRAKVSRR